MIESEDNNEVVEEEEVEEGITEEGVQEEEDEAEEGELREEGEMEEGLERTTPTSEMIDTEAEMTGQVNRIGFN